MGFKGEILDSGRTCCGSTGAYRDPISDVRRIPELETAYFTEENALSARKHDLFSIL